MHLSLHMYDEKHHTPPLSPPRGATWTVHAQTGLQRQNLPRLGIAHHELISCKALILVVLTD